MTELRKDNPEVSGPDGDESSRIIYSRIKSLELTDIAEDENFEVYRLLADVIAILKGCYKELGMGRPLFQTHSDALGITLSALSSETESPETYIRNAIIDNCRRLRNLPEDFEETLAQITASRMKTRSTMEPRQFLEEAFSAYLASRSMNEEDWIRENHDRILSAL